MKAVGSQALRSARSACCRPPLSSSLPRQAVRSFRTSTPALSRSDDPAEEKKPDATAASGKKPTATPEEEVPPAAAKENGNGEQQPQTETTPAPVTNGPTLRETLRSQGYGSARARASRTRVEEVPPPLELPEWFVDANISLYEDRPIGTTETLAFPLDDKEHESVVQLLERRFDEVALSEREVDWWKQWVVRREGEEFDLEALEEQVEEVVEKARSVHAAAFLQALALVHESTWHLLQDINLRILKEEGVEVEAAGLMHLERLRRHHQEMEGEIERYLWWFDKDIPSYGPAQRWLAHIRSDSHPAPGLHLSPLAKRPPNEYPACMELLAAIKSELSVASPGAKQKEIQRPVTVLSVLNRKGVSLPLEIIRDIATDLTADVVHLDAASLARILGNHLGQNLHWSRGSVSTLGYGAAEINGRLLSRADPDGEHELGMVVTLPSRFRRFLSSKEPSTTVGAFDGRWEDLKLFQALESLVMSADAQRARSPAAQGRKERDLIIHLHDYIEISSVQEGIITKLRHIVDRLWQRGRRVVLVGSSSGDVDKSPQWRDQLVEIGREGNLVIPLHATPGELYEGDDNLVENISNIESMLQAMLGPSTKVEFLHGWRWERCRAGLV